MRRIESSPQVKIKREYVRIKGDPAVQQVESLPWNRQVFRFSDNNYHAMFDDEEIYNPRKYSKHKTRNSKKS